MSIPSASEQVDRGTEQVNTVPGTEPVAAPEMATEPLAVAAPASTTLAATLAAAPSLPAAHEVAGPAVALGPVSPATPAVVAPVTSAAPDVHAPTTPAAQVVDEAEPQVFEVNVKTIDGTVVKLELPTDLRVSDLKELICERFSAPAERQRLIFRGRVLRDDDSVGQHITENGQTIHMVQQPSGTPSGSAPSAAGGLAGHAPPDGTHMHFEFATADPLGMPQVELSQLLGSVLGAVGRGGLNVMHAGPVRVATGPPAPGQAAAPPSGDAAAFDAGMEAQATGSAEGPPGAQVPPQPGQPQVTPLEMMLQQMGFNGEMAPMEFVYSPVQGTAGQNPAGRPVLNDALPWRDLRRLNQHLARILGRPSSNRHLPPPEMPFGELPAFLSAMHAATSQLGVAISDLQNSFVDGVDVGPQPRQQLQFAMSLVAAARTFRGLATALQSGLVDSRSGMAQQADTTAALAGATQDDTSQSPAEEGSASLSAVTSEDATHAQASSVAAVPDQFGAWGLDEDEAPSPNGHLDDEDDSIEEIDADEALAPVSSAATADLVLPQSSGPMEVEDDSNDVTTGSLTPGLAVATPPQFLEGESQASSDPVAAMPPDVAACWARWTEPSAFTRVVQQASQPPFSEAYCEGDATGSRHSPQLPAPMDFLPLRWQRSAGRVDDMQATPEHPEHLSRAYLSAVLRDLGTHASTDPTFQSVPERIRRYPNLSRLATMFGSASQEPSRASS